MTRTAVLIPGIMGSALSVDDKAGGRIELWSDNFHTTYRTLVHDPSRLAWKGVKADGVFIESISFSPISKPLWDRLTGYLDKHQEFGKVNKQIRFGYDWRQSIVDIASDLSSTLSKYTKSDMSQPPPSDKKARFVFIGHSMGGLIIRAALGAKLVHPLWIERFFNVGSPFEGAPAAFKALYGTSNPLPLLNQIMHLFHPVNASVFVANLRDCLRTFPSSYELLPHIKYHYLYYGNNNRKNPLEEPYVPKAFQDYARRAHDMVIAGIAELERFNVPVFSIFTTVCRQRPTELEYSVHPRIDGYNINHLVLSSSNGDGTVPVESAKDKTSHANLLDVVMVLHEYMCTDSKVVDKVRLFIN